MQHVKQPHVLRDVSLFLLAFAVYVGLLILLIPESIIPNLQIISLPKAFSDALLTFIELADEIVGTLTAFAFILQYYLWKKGFEFLIGWVIFLAANLFAFNYLFLRGTEGAFNEPFAWFIIHLYFSVALALAILATIFGNWYVKVHKITYLFVCSTVLLGGALFVLGLELLIDAQKHSFMTDQAILFFHVFKAIPFMIFCLVTAPLAILLFFIERRIYAYYMLFGMFFFAAGYTLHTLFPEETYARKNLVVGAFELFGILGVAVGILKENLQDFKQLKQSEYKANMLTEAKNNFISGFSFQLRTPLNAVIGYVECLDEGIDGPLNEKQKNSVEQIKKSSAKLLRLINEIIDISRIEGGKISYEVSTFSLNDVTQKIIETLHPNAEAKNLTLSLEQPDTPIMLITDQMRVRQILYHLLENGIKFTDTGEVKLLITEEPTHVVCAVSDTGKGIPKEELPTLFRPYIHGKSIDETDEGALGIGLSIVQLITNALSGTIEVKSQVGTGSTFIIRLPKGNA